MGLRIIFLQYRPNASSITYLFQRPEKDLLNSNGLWAVQFKCNTT